MTAPGTPQFHRRLRQLVGNELPGGRIVFWPSSPGAVAFRVDGPTGQPWTGVVTVPAHHRRRWNTAWLRQLLRQSPGPG